MDPLGLLMMLIGIAILWCMRDAASVEREIEPKLFRQNFPRLAQRYPKLDKRVGQFSAKAVFVYGTLIGLLAVVGGTIVAFS